MNWNRVWLRLWLLVSAIWILVAGTVSMTSKLSLPEAAALILLPPAAILIFGS